MSRTPWRGLLALVWRARARPTRRVAIALVLLGVASGALGVMAATRGLDGDHGVYRVAATHDALHLDAVRADPAFEVRIRADPAGEIGAGHADLALAAGSVDAASGVRGAGALTRLAQAVRAAETRALAFEPDRDAAYPLHVEIVRAPRAAFDPDRTVATTTGAGPAEARAVDAVPVPAAAVVRTAERAAAVEFPLPFQGLLVAFSYLIPANLVAQAFGSRLVRERLNERILPLLSAPVGRGRLVAALALAPALALLALGAVVSALAGGAWLVLLLMAPAMLLFLALELVAGLLARSYQELTLATTLIGTTIAVVVFIPALFQGIHPVALLSPVTPALAALDGRPVGWAEIALPMVPLVPITAGAFWLGARLMQEEHILHPGRRIARVVSAIAFPAPRAARLVLLGALAALVALPLEGLAVGIGLVAPAGVRLALLVVVAATIEELLKGVPVVAGVVGGRGRHRAWTAALAVGLGFFLAEKALAVVGLAAAYVSSGSVPGGLGVPIGLALLPLGLHVGAPLCTAVGARRWGRRGALVGVAAAAAVHVAYNWTVMHAFA